MANIKELNLDELENVTGGWQELSDSLVGQHVEIHYMLFGKLRSHGGEVTHCTVDYKGRGCYYIEFEDSTFDGWYLACNITRTFFDENEMLDSRTNVN